MRVRAYVNLLRPFTLLAPALGTATGAGIAAIALTAPWATPALGFAVASALLATAASNAWNQAFDVDIDRANKPTRPVPSGALTVARAKTAGHGAAVLALGFGALASPAFLACVTVGLVATWIYSAPPWRTKARTVPALLTIAIPRGLLVPVAGWSVVAPPTAPDPWALGAISGLFVLGAAATKDFSDVAGDEAYGCETLPVRFGARRAARIVAPFLVLPFALYPSFGAAGWISAPRTNLLVLATVLLLLGGATCAALLRDPDGLGRKAGAHPAWIGMYLTLLATHAGALLAYAL